MQRGDQIKDQVSLKAIAEASGVIWDKHKSKPASGEYCGSCPFHAEKTASFHITEVRGTGGKFYCFGCNESGSAIDFVMKLHGLDFKAACDRLASDAGLEGLPEMTEERRQALQRERVRQQANADREDARRASFKLHCAKEIWNNALYVETGSTVWKYLFNRGIKMGAIGPVPESLRFAPELLVRLPDGQKEAKPAIVGAIGRGHLIGVHRTWINPTGRAEFSDGQKIPKRWLGHTGKMMGRPVCLSKPTPFVIVGEGIETSLAGLSILIAHGQPRWSAEAALSLGAITNKTDGKYWTPRKGTKEVLLLGEGSSKDPEKRQAEYEFAANRLRNMGLIVHMKVPWEDWERDADWADVALAEMKGKL